MRQLKMLVINPQKCSGCRMCELWCSFVKYDEMNPLLSAIRIVDKQPVVCLQCRLCFNACPVDGAMIINRKYGTVNVTDKCIGCGLCVLACPIGIITINTNKNKALKCDYCNGDPQCVKHCTYNAIDYVNINIGANVRRKSFARGISSSEVQGGYF